jgi:hypothetical protein
MLRQTCVLNRFYKLGRNIPRIYQTSSLTKFPESPIYKPKKVGAKFKGQNNQTSEICSANNKLFGGNEFFLFLFLFTVERADHLVHSGKSRSSCSQRT